MDTAGMSPDQIFGTAEGMRELEARYSADLLLLGAGFRRPNDATATVDQRPEFKVIADIQAKAAFSGVRVDPIEADDGRQVFVVSRWSLTRQCDSLGEVRALLARMGIDA